MKFVIVSVLFFVAVQAADKEFVKDMKQKLTEHVKSCAKEVSASPADVDVIMSHNVPDTHEGKCVFFCMHKMFGAQKDDGSLDLASALQSVEMLKDFDMDVYTKVKASFENCKDTPVVSEPCDFAAALVKCIMQESKNLGLEEALLE